MTDTTPLDLPTVHRILCGPSLTARPLPRVTLAPGTPTLRGIVCTAPRCHRYARKGSLCAIHARQKRYGGEGCGRG